MATTTAPSETVLASERSDRLDQLRKLSPIFEPSSQPLEVCTRFSHQSRKLSSLPPGICDLTRLIELFLSNNELTELPPQISNLTNITQLNLHKNSLSLLPQEFSALTALRFFSVSKNKLSFLPPEISCLSGLTYLDVSGNPMEEIPYQITALKNLKKLYVEYEGRMNIRRAPRDISKLPCWNNTERPADGSKAIAEILRGLQLYDPLPGSSAGEEQSTKQLPPIPVLTSSSSLSNMVFSRFKTREYTDMLSVDFETKENWIGKGGFGIVFKVLHQGKLFAVKKIADAALYAGTDGSDPEKEGDMMLQLKHPNVLALFDFGYRGKDLLLVMEFADGGDMCSLVKKKALDTDLSIKYGLHIIQGLAYLHTCTPPIQHRDLKTENVLLVEGVAKLTDFGLSKSGVSVNSVSGFKGSKNWSPPEVFEEGKSVGLPSDVYSYGVVLWSMLTGQYPYEGLTMNEVGTKVTSGDLLPLPSSCPSILVALIHKCWERNYDSRIDAPQVEAELKQVEADLKRPAATPPMTPPTPRSKLVKDMNTAELTGYLEGKGANPKFIQACKDQDIVGLDFVLMTEEDVKELVPGLMKVQVRAVITLIAEAKGLK